MINTQRLFVLSRQPGRYGADDGLPQNLVMRVSPLGKAAWFFADKVGGQQRLKKVGDFPTMPLDAAADAVAAMRHAKRNGIDLILPTGSVTDGRRSRPAGQSVPAGQTSRLTRHSNGVGAFPATRLTLVRTLGDLFEPFRAKKCSGERPWDKSSITMYDRNCRKHLSKIAHLPLSAFAPCDDGETPSPVVEFLKDYQGRALCERLCSHLFGMLKFAAANRWCSKATPAEADWTLVREALLDAAKTQHQGFIPWQRIGSWFQSLDATHRADRVLMVIAMSAVRPIEAIGARWREFDYETMVWTIPGDEAGRDVSRMKEGLLHRVPLTPEMIAVLGEPGAPDALVFPSSKGKLLDHSVVCRRLRRHAAPVDQEAVTHGLRSSFSGWAKDHEYPPHIIEAALSHAVGSAIARLYGPTDFLELRRPLMAAWGDYLLRDAVGGA